MRKRPKDESIGSYFYLEINLDNCTIRADAFNLNVDPVRTEITGTQQIPISHVCDLGESESNEILADENFPQVCSTDKSEPESVIVNERYTG